LVKSESEKKTAKSKVVEKVNKWFWIKIFINLKEDISKWF
jgi:hypothetical protein